jgi:hypothetical protein
MGYRDKSQGFGFVYTDMAKILADRDRLTRDDGGPVHSPETPSINFNKDRVTPPAPTPAATPDSGKTRSVAMQEIRENLDRLQSLHHKLHAMLDELNKVTDNGKKRR